MSKIPRHFHFIFGLRPQTEPFHVCHYLCLESCRRINRPDRMTVYHHHDLHGEWWERIRPYLELVRVPLSRHVTDTSYGSGFIRSYNYAHHADFIRLEQLLVHGGVYADLDTLFVQPLPDAFFDESCVLGREKSIEDGKGGTEESICNALIMAEPGAPFVRRWLEEMPAALDGSWSNHSCQLAARLHRRQAASLRVEPARSFYPYMWTKEDLRALLEEAHADWAGVYSIHLWSHLWWSSRRFDFTEINGERLTERFIRRGSTTYTRAARQFLPSAREYPLWRRMGRYGRDLGREIWARRHECKRRLQRVKNGSL